MISVQQCEHAINRARFDIFTLISLCRNALKDKKWKLQCNIYILLNIISSWVPLHLSAEKHTKENIVGDKGRIQLHTQNIERFWVEVRKLVPRFGRKKEHYEPYLAECLFIMKYKHHKDRLHKFWKLAGELYPPKNAD